MGPGSLGSGHSTLLATWSCIVRGQAKEAAHMSIRRWAIGGSGAVGAFVVAAATAWACVSGPAVSLSTVNAAPGQEITITASGFASSRGDVSIRMDQLDSQVAGIMTLPENGPATAQFVVPASAAPGNHVLILTQHDAAGGLTQMPVRALLTVVPEGGAAPVMGAPVSAAEQREAGLVSSDDSISTGSLVLIGLGVAGVAMFLAGIAALFAGRRAQVPAKARA